MTDTYLADVIERVEAKAAARNIEVRRIRMRAWARWLTWAYWHLPTPYGAYADHYLWPLVRRWGFRAEFTHTVPLRERLRRLAVRCRVAVCPWVHTPDDGRGIRRVFVDGVEVKGTVYANTRDGFVRLHHDPLKVDRRRELVRTYKRYGEVRVEIA